MKEKKKDFLNKKIQNLFHFLLYSSCTFLPPKHKAIWKSQHNETLYQIKHTNRTQQTSIMNKHWKDLNLPKPYQSFHLSNKSTSLVRTGYYYPYLWWLAFEWGQKKHKNKQWISVYLIKEILNSVGIIFWWLYSRVLYWFLYQNLQHSLQKNKDWV